MQLLTTIEDLRAGVTLNRHYAEVPGRNRRVIVREITAAEKDEAVNVRIANQEKRKGKAGGDRVQNYRSFFSAMCMCDETGQRLFVGNALEEAADLLATWPSRDVQAIYDVASRINGESPESEKAALEDFDATPNSSSGTAPPHSLGSRSESSSGS